MTDHPPIPPGQTRISVQLGYVLHRLEVPSDQLEDCAEDFEGHFSMPLRRYRNTLEGDIAIREIARQASGLGYQVTVAQAGLWLILYSAEKGRVEEVRNEMWRLIGQDGGAHIIATCSGYSRGWTYEVSPIALAALGDIANPMPAAPASVTLN